MTTYKRLLFFAALFFAARANLCLAQGLLTGPVRNVTGQDNIVAVVEDRVITRDEIMRELRNFIPQIRKASHSEYEFNRNVTAYTNELIQNIIDRELIVKDFNQKGMSIPQSYLDAHFDDYLNSEFGGDRAEFLKFLQAQGKTIKQFRQEQERDLIVSYMQQQQRRTVSEISPAKIIEYYENNKSKWFSPATVKISQITLKTFVGNKTKEELEELAKNIVERARSGESFAKLARRHSQDDKASSGGDWGWYKKGELNPTLDELAFKEKVGGVTDPVTLGNMIFIMKIEERKPEGIQSVDEVRSQIEWIIADERAREVYKKWVEGLRKKAYIKYYQ